MLPITGRSLTFTSLQGNLNTSVKVCLLILPVCWLFICLIGCGTIPERDKSPLAEIESGVYLPVQGELDSDIEVSQLIKPYRDKMHAVMDEQIGVAMKDLERGLPESLLGNLVADAILLQARQSSEVPVEMALTNSGGLRVPLLPRGPIVIGDVYRLVPFDNRVVILTMSGRQIEELAKVLVGFGGQPIAGFSFQIHQDELSVSNIKVGGEPLDPDRVYRLATNDYLVTIGGKWELLQRAENRRDLTVYLRDVVTQYIRDQKQINPIIEGRIIYAAPQ